MSKLFMWLKKSYVVLIIIAFYIPLAIGAMYSFQAKAKKGDISYIFKFTGSGWKSIYENQDIQIALMNSLLIGLLVATIVTVLSLITVYAIWRTKSRAAKGFVTGTSNIPLINPDVITAISLSLVFIMMFGALQRGDNGAERAIIGQATMIMPFGITIMYPKSEKFNKSVEEASRDLGYGFIKTWFKTYFRHMLGVAIAVFLIAMAMSFDDFIITKTVSRESTIGRMMYEGSFKPWVLAMGTVVMVATISFSLFYSIFKSIKGKRK